jgi:hypothetical protein
VNDSHRYPAIADNSRLCLWCEVIDATADSDLCDECGLAHEIAGNHPTECDCALCVRHNAVEFMRREVRAGASL